MSYEIIFWGNSANTTRVLYIKKENFENNDMAKISLFTELFRKFNILPLAMNSNSQC
jgi:hypothetical protein